MKQQIDGLSTVMLQVVCARINNDHPCRTSNICRHHEGTTIADSSLKNYASLGCIHARWHKVQCTLHSIYARQTFVFIEFTMLYVMQSTICKMQAGLWIGEVRVDHNKPHCQSLPLALGSFCSPTSKDCQGLSIVPTIPDLAVSRSGGSR